MAQTAESDLNFLTRLARDLDATAKPAGGALVFVKRGEGKAVDGSDLPVPVITLAQMSRGNWKASGRGKYGNVIAEWSELGAAKVNKVSAGDKEPLLQLRHRHASQGEAQQPGTDLPHPWYRTAAPSPEQPLVFGAVNSHLQPFYDLGARYSIRHEGRNQKFAAMNTNGCCARVAGFANRCL